MGASTVTEIVDFSGGMNKLLAPHLIAKNEARDLVNTDVRFGALQSMPLLNFIAPLDNGAWFYQFRRIIYSYGSFRSNVLWDNKWYWSDGISTGKVLQDGTELPLGLPTPKTELTMAESGKGPIEGDIKYTYTFYSSDTGAESAPAPLPVYIRVEGADITLSGFEPLPPEATHYRLYRIGGYLPAFLMVDQIITTPYTDNRDDTKIDGRLLHTLRNGPPPQGLENLVELNGRFYGTVGNKIYFSALGNPDSWYVSDFFPIRTHIEALAVTPSGLLVLGRFSTSLLYGTDPQNFRLKLLSDQYGCLGKESVAYIGDSAIWLSNKQIVMCNGYKIMDVTAFKIDRLRGVIPTGACVENETYYMSYKPSLYPELDLYPSDTLYPDAVEGTSIAEQGILALDFKRGNSYSYKTIKYNEIRTVGIVDDEVHVSAGGYLLVNVPCDEVMFPDCGDPTVSTVYSLYTMNIYHDLKLVTLKYLSPVYMDSGLSILKQYDKVRLRLNGKFKITVLFSEGREAIVREIDAVGDEDSFHMIGIPNKNNLSYSIQFRIEGIGNVSSIQYSWKNREVIN